jgi:arylsulfatase A-like enzyme
MCTPTRVALLTGLYQNRFGPRFESALGGRAGQGKGLPLSAVTLAERLKARGYATGMFGKWHLGSEPPYTPPHQGFDVFRGLLTGDGDHHTQIDRSGGKDWWHGDEIEMEEGYTAELITRHSVEFIETHRERPFFLYVPHLTIHFPWQGPKDPPQRREGIDYARDKWGILPDPSNVAPHVKAMVESLDQSVGGIMAAIENHGLAEDTLVWFLSDNGGYRTYGQTHQNISDNGPLRGQKTEVFEGGHRVPAMAWWPGRLEPSERHETVMTMDLAPTVMGLMDRPSQARWDGVDLGPWLLEGEALPPRTLFWRMDDEAAVRRGPWKLVRLPRREAMLFHLGEDLGEQVDLSAREPERVRVLQDALRQWEHSIVAKPENATRSEP